ncbi:MAG: carbohydrate kinase family protein [Spirochaetota bacterium]
MNRAGITAAGNFIIDHIKVVDLWPQEGMLSLILDEKRASGGCAYNVLKDLALLKTELSLAGIGMISNDADGKFIMEDLKNHSIRSDMMQFKDGAPTSYTDVITVKDTGNRTFFHNKGANRCLGFELFDFNRIGSRLFHIGYILLLDTLDQPDPEYGTVMAKVLKYAKHSGLETSVDVVSESSYRFKKIVFPSLKYTDYLIINEIEAGRTTGHQIREESGQLNYENLKKSIRSLVDQGSSKLVCIHFPEGAYAMERGSSPHFIASHQLPDGFIKGTAGAGDAFCAGMLYGIHQNWELEEAMRFANAMAAVCLTDTSTSGGMKSIEETLRFMKEMPLRPKTI